MSRARTKPNDFKYTIEAIDVDGDGIPDGDLVTQYKNGKIVGRKFVAANKLKRLVDDQVRVQHNVQDMAARRLPKSNNISFRNAIPQNMAQTNQPIVVQNRSSLGEYVKAGAGVTIGSIAVSGLLSGLAALFDV
jgi:hypothetical protein